VIHKLDLTKLRGDNERMIQTSLRRYRIALDGSGVTREDVAPGVSPELPRINYGRDNGRHYGWMYAVATSTEGDWLDEIVKIDGHGQTPRTTSPSASTANTSAPSAS
jgi:hypothetical protein